MVLKIKDNNIKMKSLELKILQWFIYTILRVEPV